MHAHIYRYSCWLFGGLILGWNSAWAATPPCTDPDPTSVSQVKACLGSSSLHGLDAMGKSFEGCSRLKQIYPSFLARPNMEAVPSCQVLAKVLTDLNGVSPVWEPCIAFAETGSDHLVECYRAVNAQGGMPQQHQRGCQMMKGYLRQVRVNLMGYNFIQSKVPSCDAIASVMQQHRQHMTGEACANYTPNSQTHISQCLHSYLSDTGVASERLTFNCDQMRALYGMAVNGMYDSASLQQTSPPDFQTPQCPMLEEAIASYQGVKPQEPEPKIVENNPKTPSVMPTAKINPARAVEPVNDSADLKRRALERATETKNVDSTQVTNSEYRQKYENLKNQNKAKAEAEYEEPIPTEEVPTANSLEEETKQKLKKKLFKNLGL